MIDLTLGSFLKQECANVMRQTECIGIDVLGKRFRSEGPCYVLKQDPCGYFVKCVLPIAKQKGYGNVISRYQRIDINSELKKVKVRKCGCGEDLPKCKKYCEKCRKERRKKTDKENHQKQRGSCHTEV